jgi:hypothetical protein
MRACIGMCGHTSRSWVGVKRVGTCAELDKAHLHTDRLLVARLLILHLLRVVEEGEAAEGEASERRQREDELMVEAAELGTA